MTVPTKRTISRATRVIRRPLLSVTYRISFFSSRRRHTRYIGDLSSDVCSSDLYLLELLRLCGEFLVRKGNRISRFSLMFAFGSFAGMGFGAGGGGCTVRLRLSSSVVVFFHPVSFLGMQWHPSPKLQPIGCGTKQSA